MGPPDNPNPSRSPRNPGASSSPALASWGSFRERSGRVPLIPVARARADRMSGDLRQNYAFAKTRTGGTTRTHHRQPANRVDGKGGQPGRAGPFMENRVAKTVMVAADEVRGEDWTGPSKRASSFHRRDRDDASRPSQGTPPKQEARSVFRLPGPRVAPSRRVRSAMAWRRSTREKPGNPSALG